MYFSSLVLITCSVVSGKKDYKVDYCERHVFCFSLGDLTSAAVGLVNSMGEKGHSGQFDMHVAMRVVFQDELCFTS